MFIRVRRGKMEEKEKTNLIFRNIKHLYDIPKKEAFEFLYNDYGQSVSESMKYRFLTVWKVKYC